MKVWLSARPVSLSSPVRLSFRDRQDKDVDKETRTTAAGEAGRARYRPLVSAHTELWNRGVELPFLHVSVSPRLRVSGSG